MHIETATVQRHETFAGEYRILTLEAPKVAGGANPGQFIHLRIPRLDGVVLRRPFSIFRACEGLLSILYKEVGKGTEAMRDMAAGTTVSIIGPLGTGFPLGAPGSMPLLVAGGYGVAPLTFLAKRMPEVGVAFVGGAKAGDVLCMDDFRDMGWDVRVTTEDGSLGEHGRVTQAVEGWLQTRETSVVPEFFVCGPDGLLRAIAAMAKRGGWKAWLSLDNHMGCGVGACLACVQRIRGEDGTEAWARVCREGPVFEAERLMWGSHHD